MQWINLKQVLVYTLLDVFFFIIFRRKFIGGTHINVHSPILTIHFYT